MAENPPTSFRLSRQCRELIRLVAERLGIKDAAVLEIAVRRLAEKELAANGSQPSPRKKK